ncbi:hypothetical protein EYV94_21560 [Puteibacter caeruleilacunae]|nr:hypothetical protein EYV94_21560 [Puteibacter caeruleilacunae]
MKTKIQHIAYDAVVFLLHHITSMLYEKYNMINQSLNFLLQHILPILPLHNKANEAREHIQTHGQNLALLEHSPPKV